MVYKTKGTCSSAIEFEIEDGILTDIKFIGGCQGTQPVLQPLPKVFRFRK